MSDNSRTTRVVHVADGSVRECLFRRCVHEDSVTGPGGSGGVDRAQRNCTCPRYTRGEWAILSELREIRAILSGQATSPVLPSLKDGPRYAKVQELWRRIRRPAE